MKRAFRWLGAGAAAALLWLLAIWPPPAWYRTHWPAETAFQSMRGDEPHRQYRPVVLESIAPALPQAVLIGEDNAFYDHSGIDYRELRHAIGYRRDDFSWLRPRDVAELVTALPRAWSRRDALRGASTITQQLAKNLYLSPSRNPLRKVKEAVTAWRLEAALGKSRILELYLNVVELGDGVWGAEAASRIYFRKPARNLSREESAALAGALPFPLRSNPGYRPGRMRWRQALILRRMQGEQLELPPETEEDAEMAPEAPVFAAPDTTSTLSPPDSAPADTEPAPSPPDSERN